MLTDRTTVEGIPALKLLPDELRCQLKMEVFRPILSFHPFFDLLYQEGTALVRHIATSAMHERRLMLEEMLFLYDDQSTHMWFVIDGEMSYLREGMREYVGVGSWVSEAALWIAPWRHRGDFAAERASNLVGLEAASFNTSFDDMERNSYRGDITGFIRSYAMCFIDDSINVDLEDTFSCTDLWGASAHINTLISDADAQGIFVGPQWRSTRLSHDRRMSRKSVRKSLLAVQQVAQHIPGLGRMTMQQLST